MIPHLKIKIRIYLDFSPRKKKIGDTNLSSGMAHINFVFFKWITGFRLCFKLRPVTCQDSLISIMRNK